MPAGWQPCQLDAQVNLLRAVKEVDPADSKTSTSILPDPTIVSRHTAQLHQPTSWATLHCLSLLLAAVCCIVVCINTLLEQDASSMRHYLACKDTLRSTAQKQAHLRGGQGPPC